MTDEFLRLRRARATQLAQDTVPECETLLVAIGARDIDPQSVLDTATTCNLSPLDALRCAVQSVQAEGLRDGALD